ALEFPYPPDAPYISMDMGISAQGEISETGIPLGVDVRYYPLDIMARWSEGKITRTWYDASFVPFRDSHARLLKPFFYGWDLTNRAADVFYVRCKPGQRFATPLTLLAYVDEVILDMQGVAE